MRAYVCEWMRLSVRMCKFANVFCGSRTKPEVTLGVPLSRRLHATSRPWPRFVHAAAVSFIAAALQYHGNVCARPIQLRINLQRLCKHSRNILQNHSEWDAKPQSADSDLVISNDVINPDFVLLRPFFMCIFLFVINIIFSHCFCCHTVSVFPFFYLFFLFFSCFTFSTSPETNTHLPVRYYFLFVFAIQRASKRKILIEMHREISKQSENNHGRKNTSEYAHHSTVKISRSAFDLWREKKAIHYLISISFFQTQHIMIIRFIQTLVFTTLSL